MNAVENVVEPATSGPAEARIVQLPFGLLGFEQVKQYVLLARPDEEPFLRLQMLDQPSHSFIVVPPNEVVSNYQPDLAAEDVEFLGLRSPADALVLNIVTFRGEDQATVNLKGPIVLNRHTLVGRQVIPTNANQFALQHPLPAAV